MRRMLSVCLMLVLFVTVTFAQESKTWTELSEKDAQKILNDSPWGKTQTEGGSAGTIRARTTAPATTSPDSIARTLEDQLKTSGIKPTMPTNYRVRFLTAKPIREAFARLLLLAQANPDKQALEQLQAFVDGSINEYIIVAVDIERAGFNDLVQNTFKGTTIDKLKDNTYLERKDGKRVSLVDYRIPAKEDGMGIKFIFPRTIDGKPFLSSENNNVRFVCEFDKLRINKNFNISNMMYNGKSEY